jgi:hypothetical protein
VKRKHRRQLALLVKVLPEILERLERLEAVAEPPKWRDTYGPSLDMDPKPPLSDELTFEAPHTGTLWDDDEWQRGTYL